MKERIVSILWLLLFVCGLHTVDAQTGAFVCQYWIDDNIGSAVTSEADNEALNLAINVGDLHEGVHFYNVRIQDANGTWGTIQRMLFVVPTAKIPSNASQLVKYEYWIDNDYASRVTVNATDEEQTPSQSIDVSNLSAGIHFYSVRAQNANGVWGTVTRYIFYVPQTKQEQNGMLIAGYRYAFNDIWSEVTLPNPVEQYEVNSAIEMPRRQPSAVINDSCHFVFNDSMTVMTRHETVTFTMAFRDQNGNYGVPFAESVTVADTVLVQNQVLTNATPVTFPAQTDADFSVARLDVVKNATISLKASSPCYLHLYNQDGVLLAKCDTAATMDAYSYEYEPGVYYVVVYGNQGEMMLTAEGESTLPEPYAVLSDNNTVLTFYYDKEKQIRGGLDVIEWWVGYEDLSWHPYRETITNIVFDSTFINCTTLGCAAYWFRNCVNLTTISGLQYFNTENIQYMGSMFEGCYSLTDIDVSGFNTAKVTDMWNMFKNCSALTNLDLSSFNTSAAIAMNNMFDGCANLKTIYVGSEWSVSSITSGDGGANMFLGCTNLVGGAGTAYDANHTDYTYAHIDGGSSNPGYFTDKNAPVYVDLPTFRFEGDNLVMETVTEGASIFYAMADLTSTDDAVVDSVMNSLAVVPGDKNSFYYQEPVELVRNVVIKAIAVTNTAVSDTATLAYDYSAWQSLLQALSYCSDVYRRAYGNSKVDSITVDELGRTIEECHHIYEERAYVPGIEATELAMVIMELAREIEGMLNQTDTPEPYAVLSENNTVLTFYYDGNKTAYRDAMGVGPFVTLQSVAWKDYRESISSVVFNNSFANYTALSSTANWFAYCSNLTTITGLEFLKTDNVTDMNHMFYRCSGLTGIELSGFNTEQVSNMNSLFEGCSGLTSLDVSAFNTSNVTNMSWLFEGCSGLTSLDVSGFNTSSVTDMRHMFAICSALKAIYVGDDWSTVSVSEGSDMFNDCYNLVGGAGTTYNQENTDYTYAHIDGGSSNPGYFTDKNAPEYVAAPTFRFEGDNLVMETETEGASIFYQMEELPNMDEATIEKISSGMTVTADAQQSIFYEQPVEITKSVIIKAIAAGAALSEVSTLVYDYDAWQDLLKAMEYGADVYGRAQSNSAVDPAMLEDLGWMLDEGKMFYDERATIDSYEAQHFSERIMELAHQIEEMMNAVVADAEPYAVLSESNTVLTFYYDDQKEARGGMGVGPFDLPYVNYQYSVTGREWEGSVGLITKVVFDQSFANCTSITSIDGWFFGCKNLTDIEGLMYLNTSNVQSMRHVFYECSSLTNLDLRSFNTENVRTMRWMFFNCSSLTNLIVSSFNTANVIDMNSMFFGCAKLTSLDVSHFNTANVTEMGTMFDGCSSLTSLDLGNFNTDKVTNMSAMFLDCKSLTTLDVSNFNTEKVTYLGGMFDGCSGLTRLDLSNFSTSNVTNLGRLFARCANLLAVNISNFNTSNVTSMFDIFAGCTSLASVQVGNSLIPDGEYVKVGNPNLLVYVNDAALAPQGVQNVVVDGVAKEIVLTDVEEGNNNFYCPQAFTAETISYSRTFQQHTQIGVCRGWETIALPFTVQSVTHADKGAIAPFGNDASDKHFWLRHLDGNGLASAQRIEAYVPYIISMPNSDEYTADYNLNGLVTFSAQNATVRKTEPVAAAYNDSSIVMMPAMQRQDRSSDVWAINVGESRSTYLEGSAFERDYRVVRPFEAYTVHRGNGAAPRFVPIVDMADGDVTGIGDLTPALSKGEGAWYDLSGRKLQRKPSQKGVYLYNGRQVVVR